MSTDQDGNSSARIIWQDNWVNKLRIRYEFDVTSPQLGQLRDHLSGLLRLLNKTEDRWIRQMVPLMLGLVHRGTGREGIEALLPLLNDQIPMARHYAAMSLGVVAREPDDVRVIRSLFPQNDEHLRSGFIEGLCMALSGTADGETLDLLEAIATNDPSYEVRESAFRSVGYLCRAATVPEKAAAFLEWGCLDPSLGVNDPHVRVEIRRGAIEGTGLAYQGTNNKRGFRSLTANVNSDNYYLKAEAAFSFGMLCFGTANREAMQILDPVLSHPEPHARWNTGLGMGLVYQGTGNEDLLEWQEAALTDVDLSVRYYSSLGASLAFHKDMSTLRDYYMIAPHSLQRSSDRPHSLPNIDGFLPFRRYRDSSMSGLGAYLQGYSAWYALPYYNYKHFSANPFLIDERDHWTDLFEMLVLVASGRTDTLFHFDSNESLKHITKSFEILAEAAAGKGLDERSIRAHLAFWHAAEHWLNARSIVDILALKGETDILSQSLEGVEVLEWMRPAVREIGRIILGLQSEDHSVVSSSFRNAMRCIEKDSFLGFQVVFKSTLQRWEEITQNASNFA